MEPKTDAANTRTWLEGSRDIRILAYVESYAPTRSVRERAYPGEDLYDALRRVSVLLPTNRVAAIPPELEAEFQAWDVLSDDALETFEQELG